jgi:xylulokinase
LFTSTSLYTLAIDLGTSGPKVGLVSVEGRVLAHEFEETRVHLLANGGAEQDPDDWWQAIVQATQRLFARGLVDAEQVIAICCTAQWSGTVAVDAAGKPLHWAIIWMDSRGERYIRQATGGPLAIQGYAVHKLWRWLRLTGGIPGRAGKDAIAHILYLKHAQPEIYRRTYKFLEPKDYLNLRLTGCFASSVDAIALHWVTDNRKIDQIDYSERLLQFTGVEREKLPDLKRAVDVLAPLRADVAAELGLPAGLPVVVGTPDMQSAALGGGSIQDFSGHLYLGTSSWIICHVPYKKTDLLHNMASLPSAIPGRYFLANSQESAGACLTFLRDRILGDAAQSDAFSAYSERAAQIPAGSDRLIFTPWLYGERTPVEDHTVRGGFHNLSLNITQDHLIRAVLEGVAYNSRWLLTAVERFIKRPMDHLNMVGGGAQSALWCQIHADVLDRPIHQVKDPICANLRGAGLLAAVALGHQLFEGLTGQVEISQVYQPNPAHRPIYDELYNEFRHLYRQNQAIYARLNGG